MISRPSFWLEPFLLSCCLGIALPRPCHAELQPSLRGSGLGSTVSGNDQDLQGMVLLDPQKLRRAEEDNNNNNTLFIAGLFNTKYYDWIEIFNFTMTLIQERNGWHDDILDMLEDENTTLEWAVADSACDEATALQAYWDLKTAHVVHGVIGTRCSDDSILTARITGLENIPQVSPSATASTLSNKVSTTCPLRPVLFVVASDQIV
jgi:Receptor family ligand binding region